MKHYIMPDISLYQIQLFLTAAEQRNFSRAADIMNITQSALSKRISALEYAIGLTLFDRDQRPIELTPEGKVLYDQWVHICGQIKHSIDEAYILKQRTKNKLTVCWFDSGNMLGALSLVGKQLTTLHDVNFRLVYSSFMGWRTLLAKDEIDIMITIKMEADFLSDDLVWEDVVECPKLVSMLETNPLCAKDRITFEDLKNQKFVILSPIEAPAYQKYVHTICQQHGFEPKISRYAPNANSLISSIVDDDDVLICDRFLRNIDSPLIKSYELPDTCSGLIAVWKKENNKESVREFVDLLKNYYN